jgi:transcription elongation factor Elf1
MKFKRTSSSKALFHCPSCNRAFGTDSIEAYTAGNRRVSFANNVHCSSCGNNILVEIEAAISVRVLSGPAPPDFIEPTTIKADPSEYENLF